MPGIKGKSGRKTKYEERASAQLVKDIFAGKVKPSKEVMDAVRAGTPMKLKSGWDVVMYHIYRGNRNMIENLVNKIVPDKIDSEGLGDAYARIITTPPVINPHKDGYSR